MPRARTQKKFQHDSQTTAPQEYSGSGCLSGFTIIPLTVILVSALLGALALQTAPTPHPSWDPTPILIPAGISPIFRPEVLYWTDSISKWASASNLDPNLIATIMQIESCGDPRALSSAGAMGLFQVMPFHFRATDNPYLPDTNATRGIAYLVRALEAARGDARLAMAGYNGGISIIHHAEWTWPAQTKRYVQYGAPIYSDAISGLTISKSLNEWYLRYGVSLCRQAHQRLGLP